MFVRRSALLMVLFAALVGCGKSAPSSEGDKPGAAPKALSDESHTIKIREKHAGEKYEVTQTAIRSELSFQGNGKDKGPAPAVVTVTTKSAYTEVVEAVDGAAVTKGNRAYSVAEGASSGKAVPLSFAGKTIAYEVKDGKTTFALVGGKAVPAGADASALQDDLARNRSKGIAQLIPDAAVKVGEPWEVPAEKLAAVFGPGAQKGQMKATGKLEKVSTKDGKSFGVVTVRLQATLNDKGGKDSLDWAYDGCIDGSVTEGTRKSVQTVQAPPGAALPDLVNITETTIKPAK